MVFPITATPPAYFSTVAPSVYAGLYYSTETPSFTLSAYTAGTTYTVVNYYGTTVASGTVTSSTVTLNGPLPLGWYRLYLKYASGTDSTYGTSAGDAAFSVSRSNTLLPPRPTSPTQTPSVDNGIRDDPIQGWAVIGPVRYYIIDATNPNTGTGGEGNGGGNVPAEQAGFAYAQNWYLNPSYQDSARPRPAFCEYPDNSSPISSAQLTGITSSVSSLYAAGITYFEGPQNEPTLNGGQLVTDMAAFVTAVKAGNSSAHVLGPGPVCLGSAYLPAFEAFLAAGGATGLSGISFHAYNMVLDLSLGHADLSALAAALAAASVTLPLWMTECGQEGATYGVLDHRRQAQNLMLQTLLFEQYGIPKERTQYFYAIINGNWAVPTFYRSGNSVTAVPALMRVFSEEVYGKTWTSALNFGAPGNDMYLGSLFTNPSTGVQVIAVATAGIPASMVVFTLAGATTCTQIDSWGNSTTLTASNGKITMPVTELPSYLQLPSGVTATLVTPVSGVDYGCALVGPLPTSNGAAANIAHLNDGNQHVDPAYGGGLNGAPWIDTTATFPSQPTVVAPHPFRCDNVIIWAGAYWQIQGTLLDFDVQGYIGGSVVNGVPTGGTWTTLATVTRPAATTVAQVSSVYSWGCTYESFFDGQWIFPVTFPGGLVTVNAMRLNIRATTYGGEYNAAAIAAGGQGNPTQQACVRRFACFNSDTLVARYVTR